MNKAEFHQKRLWHLYTTTKRHVHKEKGFDTSVSGVHFQPLQKIDLFPHLLPISLPLSPLFIVTTYVDRAETRKPYSKTCRSTEKAFFPPCIRQAGEVVNGTKSLAHHET